LCDSRIHGAAAIAQDLGHRLAQVAEIVVVEQRVAEDLCVGGQAGGNDARRPGLEKHRARHADEREEIEQGLVLATVVPCHALGVLGLLVGEPRADGAL